MVPDSAVQFDSLSPQTKIMSMAKKPNRSKRRRPRKGFPYRVVGYLDHPTHLLVEKAAEQINENISAFVAKAVRDRAEAIIGKPKLK
jgi:hypothetical protein